MGYHQSKSISLPEILSLKLSIASSKSGRVVRRLQAVLFRSMGLKKDEIGKLLGYSSDHIQQIWTDYFKGGIDALLGNEHGGRRRFYLTPEEELSLLKKHEKPAGDGSILEIDVIHKDLCKEIGKEISLSTAYRIAKRHGWRKIEPRPHHPKHNSKSSYYFKAFFPSIHGEIQG